MKPWPFVGLNHLTVPVATSYLPLNETSVSRAPGFFAIKKPRASSMHAAPDQIVDSLPGTISVPVLSRNANQALLHRPTLGEIVGWRNIEPLSSQRWCSTPFLAL